MAATRGRLLQTAMMPVLRGECSEAAYNTTHAYELVGGEFAFEKAGRRS